MTARRAVVLAAGLGTRMRAGDDGAALEPAQAAAAESGMKSMIPLGMGRPFMDYVLSGLADAGFPEVCLVIGPAGDAIRERYSGKGTPRRLKVSFAPQERPLGTANALLAAEPLLAGEPFVVVNGDNYYPTAVLSELRRLDPPALPAFSAAALVRDGNIPPERIARYALLETDTEGVLRGIREKPGLAAIEQVTAALQDDEASAGSPRDLAVSMNVWLFDDAFFRACREVPLSERGEYEIPTAVQYAIERLGMRFRAFPVAAPVLDLSRRGDIAAVKEALAGVEVRL